MVQGATRKRVRKLPIKRVWRIAGALGGAVAVAAVFALLGVAGWHLMQLPVERVIVSGDLQRISREELMAIVSESLDGGFLGADLHSIREPIEALPWVYRVVVRRRWPDSLEIRVTEQRAIARWGEDAYLNHAGEVFHPGIPGPMEELPLLAGPDRSQVEVMQYYKLVQDYLQTLGLQVEQLSMDRRGGLSVQLTGGSRLVFGRGETRAKLRRFAQVYEQHLAPRAEFLSSVDLRYSHGVAVAWAKTQPPGKKNKT